MKIEITLEGQTGSVELPDTASPDNINLAVKILLTKLRTVVNEQKELVNDKTK